MAINHFLPPKHYAHLGCLALLILGLSACGSKHGAKDATQVAAKVDSYEITVFQVNNALARLPNLSQDQLSSEKSAVLENLVKEQLVVQQAEREKIDRQPSVLAAIDQARRDIIARAYLGQIGAGQTKPSEEEIHQYYQLHPDLFSARKIYSIKEITAPVTPDLLAYVHDFQNSGKPLEQLGQWLQDKKIKFSANAGPREPESLPLDYLPQLAATRDGGIVAINAGSSLHVMQIVSTRPAPVDEARASPNIQRYLEAQRTRSEVDREMVRLRAKAKIEYLGEFAGANNAGTSAVGPTSVLTNPSSDAITSASVSSLR